MKSQDQNIKIKGWQLEPVNLKSGKAMKQLLSSILIVSLILWGCGEVQKPSPSVLEIYGIDMSASVGSRDLDLPDTGYMRKVILAHTRAGEHYTIATYRIGESTDKPLLIETFPASEPIDNTAPPTIRNNARKRNDSLRRSNEQRLNAYLVMLQREVFNRAANDKHTNLNEFTGKAAILLNEPNKRNTSITKRVILISDCLQDGSGIGTLGGALQNPFRGITGLTLYLIGCKHPTAFTGTQTEQFQSIGSFLHFLQ